MGGSAKTPKSTIKAGKTKAEGVSGSKSNLVSVATTKNTLMPVSKSPAKAVKIARSSKSPEEIHLKGATKRDRDRLREMAESLGARLCRVRTSYKLTQKEVAAKLEMNKMTYGRYESGSRMPDADFCARFAAKFRVNTSWLLFGGDQEWKASRNPTDRKVKTGKYVIVPVYEFAGPNQKTNILTEVDPIDEISILKTSLHENTVVAIYRDSNMLPSITPGAYVGVTTHLENTPMGHIYAIPTPHEGIKLFRSYALSSSKISLRSDNPSTPDIEVTASRFKSLVLAKVEWVFQSC